MIQDLLHKDSWDSFRVEIDSAGSWALVGSNFDNAWTNADQRQATAGLSRYGIGQHTLMATVIDTDGVVTRDSVEVTILREPNSTFSLLSAEDNSKGTFVIVDTLNAVTNDYALDEIIWITSGEGERYGSPMSLQWDGKSDPLLMKPFLKTSQKVLTQGQGWYNSSDENAGITRCLSALASTGLLSALNVKRCAQKMELHKEGEFTIGRYATSSIPQKLGPAFTYDIDTDVAFYGYSFEVEITFEKPNYNPDEPLLFGQDVKRTGVKSRGICDSNGLFTSSQTDITSKHYEGNEFPFSGESYGKDAYYFNDDQPNLDQFKSIAGKVYWLDTPGTRLSDISSHAMTDFTHLGFYAKASPPCQPEGMDVCMTWEVELYVLTCEEGIFNTNSPYFAPTIENEEHPTSCHSLAGE